MAFACTAAAGIICFMVSLKFSSQKIQQACLRGAFVLAACGLLLIAGCSEATQETAAQNQQTRPRRAATDNSVQTNEKKPEMSDQNKEPARDGAPSDFYAALEKALARRGSNQATLCQISDPVSRRVLEDYGAMFLSSESVLPPPVCVFTGEADVSKFQKQAGFTKAVIGGDEIELQPAAMEALLAARKEAQAAGLDITPRGGSEAARRSYKDTRRLWDTRFLPALTHWQKRGRLSREQVARLRALPLKEQVGEVLELEKSGIFFSKDLSKSILYSIAAPGTSQHIAMLALDVTEFGNARVRSILAKHGWFQTVKSDLPHFTYLGQAEEALPSLGLHAVMSGAQKFWIPNVVEKQN
ncbi:MAG: hypothetical protein H7Y30_17755 [Pyrinomonadaceae bacterium]|nr:hypothetical protein [Pyrinomonadaceae bacterium]